MARPLRIQYPGAIYHVINRGNYRQPVFGTAGAAFGFEEALDEGCRLFQWRVHAYVMMRNHFHLALETPEPNLVNGMHWLQSTYATRFNRLRSEQGHVFQGRYKSILLGDAAALVRVVDYIHANPVRAKLVTVDQVQRFRWSSLRRFMQGERPAWLHSGSWLTHLDLNDSCAGLEKYVRRLQVYAAQPESEEDAQLCRGWAIGTKAWKQEVAATYQQLALCPGYSAAEVLQLRQSRWELGLNAVLERHGYSHDLLSNGTLETETVLRLAEAVRTDTGAPFTWLGSIFHRNPDSLRSMMSKNRRRGSPPPMARR